MLTDCCYRRFNNIYRTSYYIGMKLLGHHDWNVPLTKRQHVSANAAINTATITVATTTTIQIPPQSAQGFKLH